MYLKVIKKNHIKKDNYIYSLDEMCLHNIVILVCRRIVLGIFRHQKCLFVFVFCFLGDSGYRVLEILKIRLLTLCQG